jgi:hypothetical protein
MTYKRRQFFLLLVGSLSGLGLTTCTRQVFPKDERISKPKRAIASFFAPKGMTAPPRGDVRIVVISDLNSQYGSTSYEPEVDKAIALIPDWQADLVLCSGDMVAAQKRSLSKAQIAAMWEAFDRHIASPLRKAKIPFGFTIGNHDGSGALAGGKLVFESDRQLAATYWQDRKHDPGLPFIDRAGFPFYYTFRQNDIFYLVWDASTHIIPSQQLVWVEKSLASDIATRAKMRIVIGHLPLYPVAVGRDKAGEFLANAEQLRSLLERYHVHTYISGHQHAYFPGHKGQLELLYTGALGSGPRQLLNSSLPPRKTLTVIDLNLNSASTVYTTYDLKTLAIVDIQTLPTAIGTVMRRDR